MCTQRPGQRTFKHFLLFGLHARALPRVELQSKSERARRFEVLGVAPAFPLDDERSFQKTPLKPPVFRRNVLLSRVYKCVKCLHFAYVKRMR